VFKGLLDFNPNNKKEILKFFILCFVGCGFGFLIDLLGESFGFRFLRIIGFCIGAICVLFAVPIILFGLGLNGFLISSKAVNRDLFIVL
jgi:hypothetical protein